MHKVLIFILGIGFVLNEGNAADVLAKPQDPRPTQQQKGPVKQPAQNLGKEVQKELARKLQGGQPSATPQRRPLPPLPTSKPIDANYCKQQKSMSPAECQKEQQKSPVLILSIDGAAVRGVGQFILLQAIERQVREKLIDILKEENVSYSNVPKSITEIFDYFAGTSAGSISVGSILIPDNPDLSNLPGQKVKAKYTLDQLKEQSPEMLAAAFSAPPFRKLRTLGGLLGSKYTAKELEKMLDKVCGQTRMSRLVKPGFITSFDLRNNKLMHFSTYESCRCKKEDESFFMMPDQNGHMIRDIDVYVRQAMRASSAASTYYKPLEIKLGGKDRALIDAGLFVMSPTLLAWTEARKMYPCRRVVIISISSGTLENNVREVRTKGATAGSIPEVIKATIETSILGQQLQTDELMKEFDVEYHRLTFIVANSEFDDFSQENIQKIEQAAKDAITREPFQDAIKAIVNVHLARLKDNEPTQFVCGTRVDDIRKDKLANNYFGSATPPLKAKLG